MLTAAMGCGGATQAPTSAGESPDEQPATLAMPTATATVAEAPPDDPPTEDPPKQPIAISGDGGWMMFHGDAARTGNVDVPVITRPRVAWNAKVGIQSWLNSPLVVGDLVIVPTCGDKHNAGDPKDGVYFLNSNDGVAKGFVKLPNDANGAAATRERVFVGSDDGKFYAIDIKTQKIVWEYQASGKVYTHPLLIGDRVVAGDAGGNLFALDQASGTKSWVVTLRGAIRGGAASDGTRIYAASQEGDVIAVDLRGKKIWRKTVTRPAWSGKGNDPIKVYSTPIVHGRHLLVPFARDTYFSGKPAIVAIDRSTGQVRWHAKDTKAGKKDDWGNVRVTPAVAKGLLVYPEPYSGDVIGIDAKSGRSKFRHTVGECLFPSWSSPAAAGDMVYTPRFDGRVYAVDAASGKVQWQVYLGEKSRVKVESVPAKYSGTNRCDWDVSSGSPIYSPAALDSAGNLYVGTGEGYIYRISK